MYLEEESLFPTKRKPPSLAKHPDEGSGDSNVNPAPRTAQDLET